MLTLALSTGHKVGLAVVAGCFIAFAFASSFLFPRVRAQFPGRGLPAFIVVTVVFFVGMMAAVIVFGAESKETKSENAAQTLSTQSTTTGVTTTAAAPTTTQTTTQTAKPAPTAQTVQATETEFKITLSTKTLKAGSVTFVVKNAGKIPHDLAIAGGPKTPLIAPGKTATLTATLKAGLLELYCTVPGHKQAGMDLKLTVSSAKTTTAPTKPTAAPQTVQATETEFKIALTTKTLKAGTVTFTVKNAGKIPHDLAIAGTSFKTPLIAPGKTGTLTATLKAGPLELYCTVPGHKQAGMDLKLTVS